MEKLQKKSVLCDESTKNFESSARCGDLPTAEIKVENNGLCSQNEGIVSNEKICLQNATKKEKVVARSKKIALMAVFLAIGMVFNVLTFPSMTLFGRMTLVYFYCFLTGIVIGPWGGMIVTMLADVIVYTFGLIPGVIVPQITISNGIMAMLMGLTYRKFEKKHFKFNVFCVGLFTLVFLSAGLNAWGESMLLFDILPYTFAKTIGKALGITSPFLMLSISKLITQSFWIAINCYLLVLITPVITGIMDKSSYK